MMMKEVEYAVGKIALVVGRTTSMVDLLSLVSILQNRHFAKSQK